MEKRKRFEEMKKSLRMREKEKKKLKKKLAKEQGIEIKTGPSRKLLKLNKVDEKSSPFSVCIDMNFDGLMSDKDLSSCVLQLSRIYTINRRAKTPLNVHFTSVNEGTQLYEKLQKHEGCFKWDIKFESKAYDEIYEKEKIIYLTSESENVLEKLENGACFVIGGLVDHNSHKGLTYELATKKGIRTAKLPLEENVILASRSVLTINQVFEILIGVAEGRTWTDVLMEVLPKRKNPKLKKSEENNEEGKE
jgi:tRNA (guanine9-N1)-methyltransferase